MKDLANKIREADQLILVAGNGGSMTCAIHLALHLQDLGYRAISLSDSAIITARGNDYGIETVFSRQVEALGEKDDLLILFSTSGESPDILKVAQIGIKKWMFIIGFTKVGSSLSGMVNYLVPVSGSVQKMEDEFSRLSHAIYKELKQKDKKVLRQILEEEV